MIIDCHIHLWDAPRNEALTPAGYGRFTRTTGGSVQMVPVSFVDCRSPAELALAHMDWLGIDRAVVVQEWLDGRQDDYLAAVAREHADRLWICGLLDGRDPDGAPRYVEHMAEELGFHGLKVTAAHFQDTRLDDARFMRTWQRCAELGVRVVAHLAPGRRMVDPVATIATTFPDLIFVVAHLGLPPHADWHEQAALAIRPNVFLDASGLTALFAAEGYPFPGAQQAVKEALDIVGPGKIMWGSDYPRCIVDVSYKEILDLFRRECDFLTDQERAGILGQTAARVYAPGD